MATIPGVSEGGSQIYMAGQNITYISDELSIDIHDTLGFGAGSGSGAPSRATTCAFVTTLGPLAQAYGAGSHPSYPALVRNGEVVIYDSTGAAIFGGYATKFTDQTDRTRYYTKVECHDYWQDLDRIVINEIFSGQTDVQIVRSLLSKYAPHIDLSLFPTTSSFTFSSRLFRNVSLQKAIQGIVDTTGFNLWIDPYKRVRYMSPALSQTSPFSLSTSPDFRTKFQFGITSYEVDDNAAINRVYFYGGRKPSGDFAQNISTQANGANDTFVLAYYPRKAADGHVHVTVNGTALVVGFAPGSTTANTLIRDGGSAQVVVNSDAHNITFNTAPAAGATVICTYRYELPMVVVVSNQQSYIYYGQYLDGTISDETVFDTQVAVQRARVLLLEQAFGLKTLKCFCYTAGLQAGMVLQVDHDIRAIHDTFVIQEVQVVPLGGGKFRYELTLGAWNWSMVDVVKHLLYAAQPADTSTDETSSTLIAQEAYDTLHATLTVATSNKNHGGYYARATAVGDGHDAYPGFCTITS